MEKLRNTKKLNLNSKEGICKKELIESDLSCYSQKSAHDYTSNMNYTNKKNKNITNTENMNIKYNTSSPINKINRLNELDEKKENFLGNVYCKSKKIVHDFFSETKAFQSKNFR